MKKFAWESVYMPPICAGILADKVKPSTAEDLKSFRQIIKDKTGFFNFRGTVIAPMACMPASMIVAKMSEESQYPYIVQKTKDIYDLMKKEQPF